MVSEVYVQRGQAPFLRASGEAEHHGGRVWQKEAAHVIRKQREREAPLSRYKVCTPEL